MQLKRSADVDVDLAFTAELDVVKAVSTHGRRVVRGVASGVLEDREGERMSARAVAHMAAQAFKGLKLVASSHDQDWHNEIGKITKLVHDPDTDELIVEAELEDGNPTADVAWKRLTVDGEKLGFSVGGKCRKAFFELADRGGRTVKRRVLDEVALRHVTLTGKPAYTPSWAQAVAKTFTGVQAGDDLAFDQFTTPQIELADAAAIVAKAAPAKPDPDDEPPAPEQAAPTDAPPEAAPADAAADAPADGAPAPEQQPQTPEPPSDAEMAAGLPRSPSRHLACPNCGEEFAADLPADGPVDTPDDTSGEPTGKTAKERTMDTEATLAGIRALLDGEPVEKTAPETTPEAPEAGASDVEKMLAASHAANQAQIAELGSLVAKSAEAIQEIAKRQAEAPVGRRSVAARPHPSEVAKTAADETDVNKRVEALEQDESASAVDVLKAMNERDFGVR